MLVQPGLSEDGSIRIFKSLEVKEIENMESFHFLKFRKLV